MTETIVVILIVGSSLGLSYITYHLGKIAALNELLDGLLEIQRSTSITNKQGKSL